MSLKYEPASEPLHISAKWWVWVGKPREVDVRPLRIASSPFASCIRGDLFTLTIKLTIKLVAQNVYTVHVQRSFASEDMSLSVCLSLSLSLSHTHTLSLSGWPALEHVRGDYAVHVAGTCRVGVCQ